MTDCSDAACYHGLFQENKTKDWASYSSPEIASIWILELLKLFLKQLMYMIKNMALISV